MTPPRKESEAVPEEFARVETDSNERSVFIGDKRVVVFTNPHEVENSDAANYAAYTINLAHRRAVKDAVVEAYERIAAYADMRYEVSSRSLAAEVLAGNVIKQDYEKHALAEIGGFQVEIRKLAQEAKA